MAPPVSPALIVVPGSSPARRTPETTVASPRAWAVAGGLALALVVSVFVVFAQTARHGFLNFDDDRYVAANAHVAHGLTGDGIRWAFSHSHADNWHPLTWLSHMLDAQLFGAKAAGHHLSSVVLHAATAVVLFLVLWRMTGALWASAVVAELFAIHPLRVESVAWIAERKDVLSGLLFVLALGAYVHHARRPGPGRYLSVVVLFALGLMAKPMLVTLPFVLLLLDYWPLRRAGAVLEKIPLLALSLASCVVTVVAQRGAIAAAERLPVEVRLGNAVASWLVYLGQMAYPSGLAVFYPLHPRDVALGSTVVSAALIACLSAGAVALRHTRPYLLVGWFWYLGMLVPVIGIVQVGGQAHADRYTYLPEIGIALLVVWAASDVAASWRYRRVILGGAALAATTVLMVTAWNQTAHWRSSEGLWRHTLDVTSRNAVAHYQLGLALYEQGRLAEAVTQLEETVRVDPASRMAHNSLGSTLFAQGKVDEAVGHFRRALEIGPDDAVAHYNLATARLRQGQLDEAIQHFRRALEAAPGYGPAHRNLATALAIQGRPDEAVEHLRDAIRAEPDSAEAHNNLGSLLARQGRLAEAAELYARAIRLRPDYVGAHVNLGKALVALGKPREAMSHFRRALEIQPDAVEARQGLERAAQERGQ